MPKRGMFRKDRELHGIDADMTRRALAGLYALHGELFMKERKCRPRAKRPRTL